MTLLVIGASGQIGHCLLPRLDAAGHEWIALSRRPRIDDPRWREGRLPDRMPVLPPVSAVVGLGPLDHLANWLAAQRLPGTPHVIATSSMSAETKRDSEVPDERDVSRRLRDAETTLIATCASRGMPWTIFRPTLVYGLGMDNSLTPIVDSARRRHVFPLPSGRGLRQPVHADDIAQAVVAALGTARSYGHTFPIGGGDRMSAAEMFRRVRRSAGTMALPVPVPRWLLDLAVLVSRDLRGPVTRLDSDLIADNRDLESLLGVHPRPFQPEPSHWKSPR